MSCDSPHSQNIAVIRAKRFARLLFCAVAATAALFVLRGTAPVMAQTCKPALAIKETRFSQPQHRQRTWTAALAVDAAHCATASGSFEITFIRLKENAPDLLFSEKFTWSPGPLEVSLDFWWDEAVLEQWIEDVAPCGCAE